jgi:hypothetical protein
VPDGSGAVACRVRGSACEVPGNEWRVARERKNRAGGGGSEWRGLVYGKLSALHPRRHHSRGLSLPDLRRWVHLCRTRPRYHPRHHHSPRLQDLRREVGPATARSSCLVEKHFRRTTLAGKRVTRGAGLESRGEEDRGAGLNGAPGASDTISW